MKFILTADVIDRPSRCNVVVSQVHVNDVNDIVNTPADVDDSNATNTGVNEDVAVLNSPVANDDVTVVAQQNDVESNDVSEDCCDITDGGSVPTAQVTFTTWFGVTLGTSESAKEIFKLAKSAATSIAAKWA